MVEATPGCYPPRVQDAETSGQQGCDRNLSRLRESACQGPGPQSPGGSSPQPTQTSGEEHPYREQRLESSHTVLSDG